MSQSTEQRLHSLFVAFVCSAFLHGARGTLVKEPTELSACSLTSPDDWKQLIEKGGRGHSRTTPVKLAWILLLKMAGNVAEALFGV
jgi:hypothetical protein